VQENLPVPHILLSLVVQVAAEAIHCLLQQPVQQVKEMQVVLDTVVAPHGAVAAVAALVR
jgi:hypothetical protein